MGKDSPRRRRLVVDIESAQDSTIEAIRSSAAVAPSRGAVVRRALALGLPLLLSAETITEAPAQQRPAA
jgi:hypothetical protein